jgi:hypothetical protein
MTLISRQTCAAACAVLLAGCATSSHVLTGVARPPISPDSVKIYNQPPSEKYEQIATLTASSQGSLAITSQQNMDKAIARLKEEAAKLGANGILLQDIQDQHSSSIGVGLGGSSYSPGSASGAGASGSSALTSKVVSGVAIYVPQ